MGTLNAPRISTPRRIVRRNPSVVSKYMAAIRSVNTEPERRLSTLLAQTGLRFRRNYAIVPGTPDIAFPRENVAVFVDGCFWHACSHCYVAPSVNATYWRAKAQRNRQRDRRTERQLRKLGWSVVRIRECALERNADACVRRIKLVLSGCTRGRGVG